MTSIRTGLTFGLAAVTLSLALAHQPAHAAGDAERGAYVLRMAGCGTCHTGEDGAFLAGGHRLETPFGTFVTPNITPDPETGIGGWSDEDFVNAVTRGVSPDGDPYYPAFPYTSYSRMERQDVLDLKAYLDSLEPVRNPVPDHELDFPFSIRPSLHVWQALFFDDSPFTPNPTRTESWNRGAYLVTGPGHCGECHTPRNLLGVLDADRALAGTSDGPEGAAVPNITSHTEDGIGGWSVEDIVLALQIGMMPNGDFIGSAMADVVEDSTGKLNEADLRAIAEYLKSTKPLAND